ncbi:MAG: acetylornithine/succinylornithine family transaminase [Acidobacteria bacterium]|nr:acetylornithine/succinylornithine family transaminase [Acidobacteriota bacterium]
MTIVTEGLSPVASDVVSLEAVHIVQVYRRQPIVLVRGSGSKVYDADGREYLDLISGVGVASLGHANPRLAAAISAQARELLHCSNLFFHPLQGQVAARLSRLSGLSRTFFCNSGAEAVEACLKFTRRYWHTRGEPRPGLVALESSFHGRTIGSLSVTGEEHYRTPFEPLLGNVTFVPPNDRDALLNAVTRGIGAIIVEPIQGEGGVRPLTAEFAGAIAEACASTGALLIADEVQCGLGRTGAPFYFTQLGLKPHALALGKALGAGVPIGAAVISDEVANALAFGDHGSTYGGNLLACRAALVFLEELIDRGLLNHVASVGAFARAKLSELARRHATIQEVRGAGLMWGLQLDREAAPVVDAARRQGLLVNATAKSVVRLLPPLTITEAEVSAAVDMLDRALASTVAGQA